MAAARMLVIGAGPTGLVTLKTLREAGFEAIAVDKNSDVGGLWLGKALNPESPVYDSLNIITSKKLSQFSDFPIPDDWPDYLPHWMVRAYHQAYARHFNLYPHIRFQTRVTAIQRNENGGYRVQFENGAEETFSHVFVCTGHHARPNIPELPGRFEGEVLHSRAYENPLGWRGKRILVVGAGNSGADIATDACKYARVDMSLRRGYYIIPKFGFFGLPSDLINAYTLARLPFWLRQWLANLLIRILTGPPWKAGMPKPDHRIFETHPLVNSELVFFLKHGRIRIRPPIQRIEGQRIYFADGTDDEYDVLVLATGYRFHYPFLSDNLLKPVFREDGVYLLHLIFHPEVDDLFFIGLIQPDGNIWVLAEWQARLVVQFLRGRYRLPVNRLQAIEKEVQQRKKRYLTTPRHSIEVDFHRYLRQLKRLSRWI